MNNINAAYLDFAKEAVIKRSLEEKQKIFIHQIEHAGYGAILSRLMTGFNLSLATNSNYYFEINSNYLVEEMFDIRVKKLPTNKQELVIWDFFQHTWNADITTRAEHQFPVCPIDINLVISRHQWCSIIANIIFGRPSEYLKKHIQQKKIEINWEKYPKYIGLHIRRGDKNTENPIIPINIYVNYLNEIYKVNPGSDLGIYLSSDSEKTYDDLSKFIDKDLIVFDLNEKRYNNYNAGMVQKNKELAFQESLTCAKNITILGECDYVLGMSTAQFTWLGGLLSVYKAKLDTSKHIMIDPFTNKRGHWANYYGFNLI
jgi:hypothetical protein